MRNDTEPEPVGRKRTIQQSVPVYVDAVHEAPAMNHDRVPEGAHDSQDLHHQESAWQGDQVAS